MDNNVAQYLHLNDLQKQNRRSISKVIQPSINKLLSIFNNEIKSYTKKDTEIVVAKYHENTDWLNNYKHLTTIYNKSNKPINGTILVENVGRESHTYLHHIITNWNNLADNTLFTQGYFSNDHKPYPIEVYLVKKNVNFFAHLYKKGVFFRNGDGNHLNHAFKWLDEYNTGNMKRAIITFSEFWDIFNEHKLDYNKIIWSHGAIFSVNKEIIRNKPLGFYIYLYNILNTHRNPEEGHYFERCWYYIFNTSIFSSNRLYEIFKMLEQNYEIKKSNDLNKTYWNNLNKINIFMIDEADKKKIKDDNQKEIERIKEETLKKRKEEERRQREHDNKIRELKLQEHALYKKQKEAEEFEKKRLQMIEDEKTQRDIEKKNMRLKKDKDKADKLKRFLIYKNKIKKLQIEKEKDKELRKLKQLQKNFKNDGISSNAQKILRPNITYKQFTKNIENNRYSNDVDDTYDEDNADDTDDTDDEDMTNYEKKDLYLENIGIKKTKIKKVFENDLYSIDKI
jgi:hypothetical protein